jgi:protoporphyrin/coproporphyrin ferrochelatase
VNEEPRWIAALAALVERHLCGWPTTAPADPQALAATAREAREHGAPA